MATDQTLIAAIQRIAMGAPELSDVSSLLREIKSRGGIKGKSWKIGGDGDSQELYPDCCTNQGGTSGDPDEYGPDNPPPSIDEDAPPELPTTPDGWTDCATGQPISFTPSGFPQAESCKECAPDETWEQGFYYRNNRYQFGFPNIVSAPTAAAVCAGADSSFNFLGTIYVKAGCLRYRNTQTGELASELTISKISCGSSTADYCTVTEPPEVCGDNWTPDGATSYTLRNGCIVASKCDTDAPSSSLGCNDCITICNDQGQERQICSTSDGGFIMTDPSGTYDGGKYDANGKRTEILKAGSTGGYDGGTFGVGDGWVWN